MALVIPPGYAHISIPHRHVSQSRTSMITFGVVWSSDIVFPVQRCNDIQTAWTDNLGGKLDAGLSVGPTAATIGVAGGENVTVEGDELFAPPNQLSVLPSNVALLVRKSTARGGRRGRGRFYVPWILPENDVDDVGQIDATQLSSLQQLMNDFLATLEADQPDGPGTPMALLHDAEGNSAPGSPNLVTGLTCDSLVATQRRRLGR